MFITKFIAFLIFLSGVLNIVSAFSSYPLDRLFFLRQFFPVEFLRVSRTGTLLIGFFLIFLAKGLLQRKFRSWIITVCLLATSIITNLLKALDFEESMLLLIPLFVLIKYRSLFIVQSGRIELINSLKLSLYFLAAIILYAFLGYSVLRYQYDQPITPANIFSEYTYSVFGIGEDILVSKNLQTKVFEATIKYSSLFSIIIVFAALYAPFRDKKKPTENELITAKHLVIKKGKNANGYFALMKDKNYFFLNEKCFLAFKIKNGCAVVLGDPIGEKKFFLQCIQSFIYKITRQGLSIAFYSVSEENLSLFKKVGFESLKIGEEAVIGVKKFNLEGSRMKDIRYGANRMEREGVTYKWLTMDNIPFQTLDEMDKLHAEWLKSHKSPRLSYSLDYFPFPPEAKAFILLAYGENNVLLGCLSFFPYNGERGLVVDAMFRNLKSPNGLMEGMFAESIFHFRDLGYKEINLNMSAFSNSQNSEGKFLDRGTKMIFEKVNTFYKYQSLHNFKSKFNPKWNPKYLIYSNAVALPKVAMALVQVHLYESENSSILEKARELLKLIKKNKKSSSRD